MEIERVYNDLWVKLFVDIYQLIQVQIFGLKLWFGNEQLLIPFWRGFGVLGSAGYQHFSISIILHQFRQDFMLWNLVFSYNFDSQFDLIFLFLTDALSIPAKEGSDRLLVSSHNS